jgi:phosphoglycolate phosphatase-like HAD superfamily hydrolase
MGVAGITKVLGRPHGVMIERIAQIFQEVYLGPELLKAIEKKKPVFWKKRGLINHERLIFKKPVLEELKEKNIQLGIATGRPHYEAVHILKQFEILDLFTAITTMDDVRKAERTMKQSLRKPHPFSILETAKKIGSKKHFFYVGDLPDDILATNHAKAHLDIRSIAFPAMAQDMKLALAEIQKVKPDFIIQKPADLLRLI